MKFKTKNKIPKPQKSFEGCATGTPTLPPTQRHTFCMWCVCVRACKRQNKNAKYLFYELLMSCSA